MPRTARASVGEICYHVINRGNARQQVFQKQAFVELIGLACEHIAMRVLAYCVMPNHFHLGLWPYWDGDLGRWMQWLLTSHVRRYHRHYGSSGHVWQGRFKAFPIQQDEHLLTCCAIAAGIGRAGREMALVKLRARTKQPGQQCRLSMARGKA